ncbi:YndM family protein [Mesobacillus maritimus]|uniref:YndM family protein n=1 Tax=Mesobacillus maritimus TaxID=1643336 RepID=UPI00203D6656|nr:YndM family protein [Mesobacillus maritimus]MCM3585244.1 YndM family protein [Mesobacillus maritimus]
MKHVWALLIKFTAIGTMLFPFLSIFNNASLMTILFITVVTTVVSYFLGDLYLLPKLGNFKSTLADFGLSFLLIWIISAVFINSTSDMLLTTLFSALLVAGVEPLFHLYMKTHIFSDSAESVIPGVYKGDLMMTEYSEELDDQNFKKEAKNPDNQGESNQSK